ncbi:MAG: cysteine desulfurase [Clostridiales bacterium]|nr:cysteine desulfurase [Clostridiales bacterium]
MKGQVIYLDYAATTPVDGETIAAALPYYGSTFYNPASTHMLGQIASSAVEFGRRACERAINADRGTVYFTSGGTEAINQAMKCVDIEAGSKVAVSAIEHDAVKACAEYLSRRGHEVVTVMPTEDGIITPEALEKAIEGGAALVCVMTVNNIVGTIQPIRELAQVAHRHGALFFTDAVQAVNSIELDVKDSDVDMLCVSGHKFYALKGSGFLYVKKGVKINALLDGGRQEYGLRAGTVDVPAVMALADGITRAQNCVDEYNAHAKILREAFLSALDCGKQIEIGPHVDDILSVAFDGVDGGRLAVALSVAGVCCSVGSACSAGSATPPDTLVAMKHGGAASSVRFSFGKPTTKAQAEAAAKIVNDTVKNLLAAKV